MIKDFLGMEAEKALKEHNPFNIAPIWFCKDKKFVATISEIPAEVDLKGIGSYGIGCLAAKCYHDKVSKIRYLVIEIDEALESPYNEASRRLLQKLKNASAVMLERIRLNLGSNAEEKIKEAGFFVSEHSEKQGISVARALL